MHLLSCFATAGCKHKGGKGFVAISWRFANNSHSLEELHFNVQTENALSLYLKCRRTSMTVYSFLFNECGHYPVAEKRCHFVFLTRFNVEAVSYMVQ